MVNKRNSYHVAQVKSIFKGLYVILTNGSKKIANIATISEVEVINNDNDLILQITGNKKNNLDGVFIVFQGVYYKLSFEIRLNNISEDILKSYMLCYEDKINYSYDFFYYCRIKNKVKQVRLSSSGGTFLDWYSNGKKTNYLISSYDGIWISGNYIRVLPIIPPSLEFSISETLFEMFNQSKPFTSVGSYEVYVPGSSITANDSYYDKYITINGIVIPDVKSFNTITNDKLIAIDKYDKEFIIYANKKEDSENIA